MSLDPLNPLALAPKEQSLSNAAIDAFTVALGGREALTETLEIAGGTPEVDRILLLLMDSRYATWSLRKLCTLAGLTIADLFAAYKSALIVKAHVEATKVVTDHLVTVVDDIMRRSQPHEVACDTCTGLGQVTPEPTKKQPTPSPVPCLTCRGTGRQLRQPDLDRQKVALELGQLLTKGGGINLTQNQATFVGQPASTVGSGALDALQQVVGEILTPRTRRAPTPTTLPVLDVVDGP